LVLYFQLPGKIFGIYWLLQKLV